MRKILQIILLLTTLASTRAFAQTPTTAQTKLVYNLCQNRYEVYVMFNENGPVSIGTSLISIILPGTAANSHLTITPVNGGGWGDNSTSYDVGGKDYHGIVTTGQGSMAYGTAGSELLLFTFVAPGNACIPNLRLWTSGLDLDQTPDGTDYISNIYTPANFNYILTTNYGGDPSCNCSMTSAGLQDVTCNDDGTPNDASDDYITFTLNPTGASLCSTYNVTVSIGSVSPTSGTYGAPITFTLQGGSAGSGDIIVTVTDSTSPACTLDTQLTDPGICSSNPCSLPNCVTATVTKN